MSEKLYRLCYDPDGASYLLQNKNHEYDKEEFFSIVAGCIKRAGDSLYGTLDELVKEGFEAVESEEVIEVNWSEACEYAGLFDEEE